MSILSRALFLLMSLLGTSLCAEQDPPQPQLIETSHYWGQFMSMLLALAFVICLVFFITWILKKMTRIRVRGANAYTKIKIIEKRTLSQKSSLYLLEIGNKEILICDCAAGIRLITESPKVELRPEEMPPSPHSGSSFTSIFSKLKKKQRP